MNSNCIVEQVYRLGNTPILCGVLGNPEEFWAHRVVIFRAWQLPVFCTVHQNCTLQCSSCPEGNIVQPSDLVPWRFDATNISGLEESLARQRNARWIRVQSLRNLLPLLWMHYPQEIVPTLCNQTSPVIIAWTPHPTDGSARFVSCLA